MATIFKVTLKNQQPGTPPRLIKADGLKALRGHLLGEFEVTEATAEDAHKLGELGVKIETATE